MSGWRARWTHGGFTRRELLLVILIILALLLTVWFLLVEPLHTHDRWYDRVRADILSLARKRPPEVSREEWESVVCWTLNLHANCGHQYRAVESGWREHFADEFGRRVRGPVTLADIEWIWDEYAGNTRYGQTYSDLWRPTRAENHSKAVKCGILVD